MSTTSKKWFAVSTLNKSERKVCILLNKKKIETYYPMNKMVLQNGDKEKVVYQPLLNNFVFVFASESEHTEIKNTEGIKSMLYWLGEPAIVKTEEVDMLRNVISEYQNFSLEKIRVDVNGRILVDEFHQRQNEEFAESPKQLVKVSLPSIGYAILAESKSAEGKLVNINVSERSKSMHAII